MTYKFEQFATIEIVDPEIQINPVVKEVDPVNMTISVDVVLISGGNKFGVQLTGVKVVDLTYTAESLHQRVIEHLQQYTTP